MKTQNAVWKKILKMSLAGTFAVTPLMMGATAAQAAPPRHSPAKGYRGNDHHNDKTDRNRDRNDYRTMTGQATNVHGQQFDLRVGNTTYNVYSSSRLPNDLSQGDTVRVYGQRRDNNDIRNANVSVISNNSNGVWRNDTNNHRWDNRNNNRWGNYQTFTGTVTDVDSNSRFDVRVGNETYNVYASGRVPGSISKNDIVRIYGQRSGNNDIRNANVVIVRDSNNGNWNNRNDRNDHNRWNNYQTFTGTVTDVDSNSRFDVRVGNETYNVYASGRVPGNISKNDIVRIYGQRSGNNDIRNANVVVVHNR